MTSRRSSRVEQELLSVREAAIWANCGVNTVYRLVACGDLPAIDIAPSGSRQAKTRIALSDLQAWANKRKRVASRNRPESA